MACSNPILVLNGAEETLQIVVGEADRERPGSGTVLCARSMNVPGRAMQFLAPAVDEVLSELDLRPTDLAGVASVRGPGGFTGLRLVLATALGLSVAAGVPQAGLDYLPLLAAGPAESPLLRQNSGLGGREGFRLYIVTHSRQRQVYLQAFSAPALRALDVAKVMGLEEAMAAILASPLPFRALGSGLRRNADFFASLPPEAILDRTWDTPSPEVLLNAALAASFSPAPVEPLYLRASDAEENLPDIAAGRGLSEAEARERLLRATLSSAL